jgi:membrane-associated PAP2 superfamily phosphatase
MANYSHKTKHMLNPHSKRIVWNDCLMALGILAITLMWDYTGQDRALAHYFGTQTGFELQNDVLLKTGLHDIGQHLSRLCFVALILMIWRPFGIFKILDKQDRIHIVSSVLLASIAITTIKRFSQTSCPWSLIEFGGIAPYVSHWQWTIRDGGGGHCFPGGHASAGFAFISASFWLRRYSLRFSQYTWWSASFIGMLFGWAQQIRGAHFFSHTLWSWTICASIGLIYFYGVQHWRNRHTV